MKRKVAEIKVSYSPIKLSNIKIAHKEQAVDILRNSWNKKTIELQEEFKALLLNRANQVLGIYPLSKGGTNNTVVDVKLLLAVALKCNTSGIIICHNHPSGNIQPSTSDKKVTEQIKKATEILDITLLDHIILTKEEHFSFTENGLLLWLREQVRL